MRPNKVVTKTLFSGRKFDTKKMWYESFSFVQGLIRSKAVMEIGILNWKAL